MGSVAPVLPALCCQSPDMSLSHPANNSILPQSPLLSRLTYLGQVMPTDHFSSAARQMACVTAAVPRFVVCFFFLPRCNLWHTVTHRWKHHSDVGAWQAMLGKQERDGEGARREDLFFVFFFHWGDELLMAVRHFERHFVTECGGKRQNTARSDAALSGRPNSWIKIPTHR